MNSSEKTLWNNYFSHIYIESDARRYELTDMILAHFPKSVQIDIEHYKDVFNRPHQDYAIQKQSPALILAVNRNTLIYPGAKVCQDFGNAHFYYTGGMLNCIYDCDYCYLQGMYPSADIVVYVNLTDVFDAVSGLLKVHPVYLCISYDTDLLALDAVTGFHQKWTDYVKANDNLTIEIRTKSAHMLPKTADVCPRIIYAWTLSPEEITKQYEHRTPSLSLRLSAVQNAIRNGYRVRLCFDPMIYVPDYAKIYGRMFDTVFEAIDGTRITDVGLGLFRIPTEYVRNLRAKKHNPISAYPYDNVNGVSGYSPTLSAEMLSFAKEKLGQYVPPELIYTT